MELGADARANSYDNIQKKEVEKSVIT